MINFIYKNIIRVPHPVQDYFWQLVKELPPGVTVTRLGSGYHVAGWSYFEARFDSEDTDKAAEYADRILLRIMWHLQLD